jgi:predicted transcriptional regulator
MRTTAKRDKMAVLAQVLTMASAGVRKNQILSEAGMSSEMLNRYLRLMTNARLLEEVPLDNKTGFRTSRKGTEFLQFYREIVSLMKNDDNYDNRTACKKNQPLPNSLSS